MASIKHPKMTSRLKVLSFVLWFLVLILKPMPTLTSESLSDSGRSESISFAADAIGMYLKKIANKELFVLKMQDIFDMNSVRVQEPPKPNGMYINQAKIFIILTYTLS